MDFSSKKNVEFICCQCKQMTTLKTCPDCVIKNIIWIGERGLGLIDWPCVQFFGTSSAVIISVFSVTDTNTKLEKKKLSWISSATWTIYKYMNIWLWVFSTQFKLHFHYQYYFYLPPLISASSGILLKMFGNNVLMLSVSITFASREKLGVSTYYNWTSNVMI